MSAMWVPSGCRVLAVLGGRSVTVDLDRMEERDGAGTAVLLTRSPVSPGVRRLLGPEVAGPEEAVRLLTLDEGSEEFGDAVRHFYGTLQELRGRIRVVRAQQLIHPRLYGQFRRRRAEMERRGVGASEEQLLFHGTTAPRGLAVCLHGFRPRLCGTPRCRGVSFAVTAALAAQERHSPTSADGTKCILVAKVLTGSTALDRRSGRAMGGTARHRILLSGSAERAYPLYLLTCQRLGTA